MQSPATFAALADLSLAFDLPSPASWGDSELLEAQRSLAEIRRRVDAASATLAAEIGHRSRRELGYDGLAQRLGARTAEALIQRTAGTTAREAHTLVSAGAILSEPEPWLGGVAGAVRRGELSVENASAARAGLGPATAEVTAADLGIAAQTLLAEAPGLTAEKFAARARELRHELDLDLVADREAALRDQRFARTSRRADGMTLLTALLDPENAAIVVGALDAATSPRRGGPRFTRDDDIARAERILADTRSTEQLAADALVELVRLGIAVDDGSLLGSRSPEVHIVVTRAELESGSGAGYLEGSQAPLSLGTVERRGCATGTVPILFDGTRAIDVGRTKRLFTGRQRKALAARDGGCRFPGCERPPSWTEAHHITEWSKGGRTDLRDGILLCRHHHLLTHNNHWRVIRRGDDYFVVPPPSVDPAQAPIPAPSRSAALRRRAA